MIQPKPGTGLMTIAFDLDGTLAEPTWPSPAIGSPIEKAVDAMLEYWRKGFEIIIFTSRPASHREAIKKWLENFGLSSIIYDIVTDKPRAAMYVDDRAATFPEAFEHEPKRRRMKTPLLHTEHDEVFEDDPIARESCVKRGCKVIA